MLRGSETHKNGFNYYYQTAGVTQRLGRVKGCVAWFLLLNGVVTKEMKGRYVIDKARVYFPFRHRPLRLLFLTLSKLLAFGEEATAMGVQIVF